MPDIKMNSLINIERIRSSSFSEGRKEPFYFIITFEGQASFSVDFSRYQCSGKTILFLSPYQFLEWHDPPDLVLDWIQFHGDFYCIEYHKKEVACNGVLFNNIYQQPFVTVSDATFEEVKGVVQKMRQHLNELESPHGVSIISTYLQLILALSSKEKLLQVDSPANDRLGLESITGFQDVLEEHFRDSKEVAFYAGKFGLAVNTFSKKIKKHFGKSPTKLIQERIALEAKKLLHLTHKPVKEIAAELNFEDEFYFSRYFKREVGVSPAHFRDKVGISIVAE